MPATIFPAALRPSTAMPGVGDDHDDLAYSACVLAHGGVGLLGSPLFAGAVGTPIPQLTGGAITAANIPAHYQNYMPITTVVQQAGMLGHAYGDFSVRAIGITIDQTPAAAGVPRVWGATAFEVIDICSKLRIEVKLSGKRRIGGPAWSFPQVGGPMGFSTATNQGLVANGLFATGRRIASKFEIARNDTIAVDVAADAALAFSDTSFATTHTGQASLMWLALVGTARSDVR